MSSTIAEVNVRWGDRIGRLLSYGMAEVIYREYKHFIYSINMLTVEKLKAMKDGEIFVKGELYDHYEDHPSLPSCDLATTGETVRWVAVRWKWYHDWAVYAQNPYYINSTDPEVLVIGYSGVRDWDKIADIGDKIGRLDHVEKLVPCDDDALQLYRS